MHGIDVSDDQGDILWDLVADHVDFAYVQVGYATATGEHLTHTRAMNVHASWANGLKVGAYFFAYPVPGRARHQGEAFLRMVGPFVHRYDLPFAVDVEINPEGMSPADMSQWVRDFLDATGLSHRRLAVYTSPAFWAENTDGSAVNAHLWVAAWGAPKPPRLKGLPDPFMWQTTARGQVPGIQGPVDLDTLLFWPDPELDPHQQKPPANWQDLPGGPVLKPPGVP